MRVCLGGTFGPFHAGHAGLLSQAIETAGPDGHVFIGVVDDSFATGKRSRPVGAYEDREGAVKAWLAQHAGTTHTTVNPLTDTMGPSATGDYDVIVTSPETAAAVAGINRTRMENGLEPLDHVVAPWVLGADLLPINATRVAEGDIDIEGNRLRPVRIAVGSENPVKVEAARQAFAEFLGLDVEARGHTVPSGVAEQPIGEATWQGAANRARAALESAIQRGSGRGPDYAVGIEAGLFPDPHHAHQLLDVQWAAVVDRSDWATSGHGPGFAYPSRVASAVRDGRATIEEVVGEIADDDAIGRTQGAVGFLTKGRLDRTRLTKMAVEAALVPRPRRELYL